MTTRRKRKRKHQLPPGISPEPTVTLFPGHPTKQRTATRCQRIRRNGRQCTKPAINGADQCKTHGGKLTKAIGPANPNWKGGISHSPSKVGRWVSLLAPASQASYIRSLEDPELLSLVGEINLVDVRLEEAVKRTTTFADWSAVKNCFEQLVSAMATSDSAKIKDALNELRELSYGQVDNDLAWREVLNLTDRRRELVESERRRKIELSLYLTREQAQLQAQTLLGIIQRNVKDRDTLIAIVSEYRSVMEAARGPVINV